MSLIIKPCNSYAARPAGTAIYRSGPSAFKIYYADIYGREHPERYEWDLADCGREAVSVALTTLGVEGVGFVVAFPHIAKLWRFWPNSEILLVVSAFQPADGARVDLDRGAGEVEFACLAEAVVAADEYQAWARSASVEEWLAHRCQWPDLPIADHTKLARYVASSSAANG